MKISAMTPIIREISLKEIEGVSLGHAQDNEAKTGVSVIYFEHGAQTGCDISGGGPASRETPLTDSMTADNPLNAVVLSGGSAFGLAASDGVMKCLEEYGIGFDTGFAKVPLVCQSCIFDLGYGRSDIRPTSGMGYEACQNALRGCDDTMGNVGAGTGASVGKLCGMRQASKAGLGIHAVQMGELKFAAIVVVNAFGDIFNPENGKKIAGLLDAKREHFADIGQMFIKMMSTPKNLFHTGALEKEEKCQSDENSAEPLKNNGVTSVAEHMNTTIGCVITNAKFDKAKLNKIAAMTRNAYARCIDPVGTMADGDSIYACSVGDVVCDINLAGMLGAAVMEEAIKKAVKMSGIPDEEFLKYCL